MASEIAACALRWKLTRIQKQPYGLLPCQNKGATRRSDRIDRGSCPRGLCEHTAAMQVKDGHCVVCWFIRAQFE